MFTYDSGTDIITISSEYYSGGNVQAYFHIAYSSNYKSFLIDVTENLCASQTWTTPA